MIFLEAPNLIIKKTLEKRLAKLPEKGEEKKREHCDVRAGDFDGARIRILAQGDRKEQLLISLFVNCGDVVAKYGLQDLLKSVYGDIVEPTPFKDKEINYTATLKIPNVDALDDKKIAQYINDIPLLKRYVMMPPFVFAFDKFLKGEKFDAIRIPYRDEENIYLVSYEKTSLVVVYSIKFKDPDDVVLARTFLQEFKDARRDRTLSNAPPVSFTQGSKPLELTKIKSTEPDSPEQLKEYGFVSFSLFTKHCSKENRIETIDKLLSFRNYLHYHLKCSKAYMHIRMRDRVTKLLQALEAAKDDTGKQKVMKTFSGRTFKQSD
jgi:actin related protein 2/3 complex subunit 2